MVTTVLIVLLILALLEIVLLNGAAAVRIHPPSESGFAAKQKTSAYLHTLRFFGGRGWMSRAAHLKKPTGLFLRRLQRRRRSCSNPPSRVRLKMPGKTKNQRNFHAGSFGGAKQPKSEPLPSGASLAAISSKAMVFVPSL